MNNRDLLQRFHQLESNRAVVQETWEAIERFCMPYRGKFFRDQSDEGSIDWNRRYIFDSTAVSAQQTLASSLHSGITNPAIQWFDLRFRNEKLNENRRANEWMQSVADRVYFELQDSNFNLEINETYQDLVGYGTSFMTLEEVRPDRPNWDGLNFSSVPLKQGYFEEDDEGRLVRFYRHLKWTPTQIIARFGTAPDSIMEAEKAGHQDKRNVLYVITPRKNATASVRDMNVKKAPSKRDWEYRYILMDEAVTLGKPGGYYEMPTFAVRWAKTSESQWGNSPAMLALGDILSVNKAREMQLRMAEKLIDPPIFAEERALLSDLNISAGALNVVRSIQGLHVFESKGSFPVSDAMIESLQQSIEEYFYINELRLPPPQAQPMTATEIQMRKEQMERKMATTLGRIANDLLDPVITRTVRMLARAGEIPPPPQVVIDENAEWDILYIGSMSRAQRVDKAASTERLVMMVGQMAPVLPEMIDTLDADQIVRQTAMQLDTPAEILKDKDEVEQIQKDRKAQQEQMLASQQAAAQGQAMESQGKGEQAMVEAAQ